jgi:hypothetical protein
MFVLYKAVVVSTTDPSSIDCGGASADTNSTQVLVVATPIASAAPKLYPNNPH